MKRSNKVRPLMPHGAPHEGRRSGTGGSVFHTGPVRPKCTYWGSMLAKCSLFYSYLQFMEILRKFSQKTSKIWPLIRLVSKQLLLIILWSYLKSNYLKTRTLLVRERERENVFASYKAYKDSTISRAFQSFQNKMLVAGERLMNEFRIWTL